MALGPLIDLLQEVVLPIWGRKPQFSVGLMALQAGKDTGLKLCMKRPLK